MALIPRFHMTHRAASGLIPEEIHSLLIEHILQALEDAETYGIILRAKGYVANAEGEKWIHFDYVPGEPDIRDGGAMVTGRICVIGSKLNEEAVAKLFGVEKQ